MIRAKVALAVGLGLVALLIAIPLANAKQAKHGKGPLPDLVVGKVSKPPASVVVGSEITISVKLRNKGHAKAHKSKAGLYLAKGKKLTHKDRRLEQARVRALRSHKKAKAKFKVVLPAKTAPGTYRLIACADDKRSLHESKENGQLPRVPAVQAHAAADPSAPTRSGQARVHDDRRPRLGLR